MCYVQINMQNTFDVFIMYSVPLTLVLLHGRVSRDSLLLHTDRKHFVIQAPDA